MSIILGQLNKAGREWAQETVRTRHYLHQRCSPYARTEGYSVHTEGVTEPIGVLLFGRPQATRVRGWYEGKTYWEVINLARVWFDPRVQKGGDLWSPCVLPGFVDRRGWWRSTLATTAIGMALGRIGFDYLLARPPCYLDDPYELRWCLSYCDTRLHKGTIYAASGFERYATGNKHIETWRIALPALMSAQHNAVRAASEGDKRARAFRAKRGEQQMVIEGWA